MCCILLDAYLSLEAGPASPGLGLTASGSRFLEHLTPMRQGLAVSSSILRPRVQTPATYARFVLAPLSDSSIPYRRVRSPIPAPQHHGAITAQHSGGRSRVVQDPGIGPHPCS